VIHQPPSAVEDRRHLETQGRIAGLGHRLDDLRQVVAGGEAVADEQDVECLWLRSLTRRLGGRGHAGHQDGGDEHRRHAEKGLAHEVFSLTVLD